MHVMECGDVVVVVVVLAYAASSILHLPVQLPLLAYNDTRHS
jgi:hypothetical protein